MRTQAVTLLPENPGPTPDSLCTSSTQLYVMQTPMNNYYGNVTGRYGDSSECMRSVY